MNSHSNWRGCLMLTQCPAVFAGNPDFQSNLPTLPTLLFFTLSREQNFIRGFSTVWNWLHGHSRCFKFVHSGRSRSNSLCSSLLCKTASRSSLPSLVPFVPWITNKSPGFNCRWSCTRHHETTMEKARDVARDVKTHQYVQCISIRMFASSCLKHVFHQNNTYCWFARLCHEFAFLILHPCCSSAFSTTPRQALQRGQIERNLHSSARAKQMFCFTVFVATYCYTLLHYVAVFTSLFLILCLDLWPRTCALTSFNSTSHTCPQWESQLRRKKVILDHLKSNMYFLMIMIKWFKIRMSLLSPRQPAALAARLLAAPVPSFKYEKLDSQSFHNYDTYMMHVYMYVCVYIYIWF